MIFKYSLDQIVHAADYLNQNLTAPIICFNGPMGVGKTTLISALCKKWSVTDTVSSPTFSIVNQYESEIKGTLFHFDFYRLKNIVDALDIGVEEYLDSGKICLIEWGEKIETLLPENIQQVDIGLEGSETRVIKIF